MSREGIADAVAAHERARADLRRVVDREPAVLAVAASLRQLREQNHFAERLTAAMRGEQ